MVVAVSRVEASRAQAKLVDASTGLQVALSASGNRQHLCENGCLGPFADAEPVVGAVGITSPGHMEGTIGLVAGYLVDLWRNVGRPSVPRWA